MITITGQDIRDRLARLGDTGADIAPWMTMFIAVTNLVANDVDAAVRNPDRILLLRRLSKAGRNAFWSMARGQTLDSQRVRFMRASYGHQAIYTAVVTLDQPTITVRDRLDVSGVTNPPVAPRELSSERARAFVGELLTDPLQLDADQARELLLAIVPGVYLWR